MGTTSPQALDAVPHHSHACACWRGGGRGRQAAWLLHPDESTGPSNAKLERWEPGSATTKHNLKHSYARYAGETFELKEEDYRSIISDLNSADLGEHEVLRLEGHMIKFVAYRERVCRLASGRAYPRQGRA
eukprot:6187914-Pleurochrysis_carterae.AAC.1